MYLVRQTLWGGFWQCALAICTLAFSTLVSAKTTDGKILATPGVSQFEGAGGGGFVPWAQLGTYASRDDIDGAGFCSYAKVDDYDLDVCGARVNFYDRVSLGYARQSFHVDALDLDIEQDIVSAKVRLYGDVIYSTYPQVSFGVMHKTLDDPLVANLLGAKEDSGTDYYVAASKVHLAALWQRHVFWNATVRNTSANQAGLLGHGGSEGERHWLFEGSLAMFVNQHLAVGVEYRQKPDNLGLGEEDWQNVFVAFFPNKHLNVTLAYINLGSVAGAPNQDGVYLSLSGYW